MSQNGLTKLLAIITERPFKVFKIIITNLNHAVMILWFIFAHIKRKNPRDLNQLESVDKLG